MPEQYSFNPLNDPRDGEPLDLDHSTSGNRPASGARQATPGEVLSSSFYGSENAGDFLGLDVEFHAEPVAGGPGAHLDVASAHPFPQTAPAPVAPPLAAVQQYADEDYEGADVDDAPVSTGALDEFEESLDAALARDEGTGSRKGPLVAAAFVVGLLAVAGAVYGPELLSPSDSGTLSPPISTARADPTTAAPVDTTAGSEGAAFTGAETDPGATDDLIEDVVEYEPIFVAPQSGGEDVADTLGDDPYATPSQDEGFDPFAEDTGDSVALSGGSSTRTGSRPTLVGTDATTAPGAARDLVPSRDVLDTSAEFPTDFTFAEGGELDMIWRGDTVPLAAIGAPSKVLTPHVGVVRLHMESGEVFDGRLWAVGLNQVWVDARPGRIGLDAARIVQYERLPVRELNDRVHQAATGERVRVQVPGGVLYGRVLSSDDDLVTLVTDGGGKVTVKNPVVQPLGPSRAMVVKH